jgi:Flp pilus assembly protein TadG
MGKRPPAPGQSLVEIALLLPILTMLLFGIIEVSIVLTAYVNLTNTAREGARAGSVYQETSALTSQSDVAGMDGRRLSAISTAMTPTISPAINTSLLTTTVTYTPTTPLITNMYRAGDTMEVKLTYTHKLFFNLIGRSITLRATSSMRIEPGGASGGNP